MKPISLTVWLFAATSCLLICGASSAQALSYDADAVVSEINSGWPLQIENLKLDPTRNYVVVVMSPPSAPLDLRTAENFRETLIGAQWAKATIGHAMIGWQCQQKNASPVRGFTGLTGESQNQSLRMAQAGWGATAFLSTFTDGHIQGPKAVEAAMNLALERDRKINVIAIEVSANDCMQSPNFVSKFVHHPNEPLFHFGLRPDPAKFEGGGCGSFAVTIANQAGIWNSLSSLFWRTLHVPKSLMGFRRSVPPANSVPYYPWPASNEIEVPLNMLQESPWIPQSTSDPTVSLRLVDPEMMLLASRTLRAMARTENSASSTPSAIEERVIRAAVPFPTHDGEHAKTGYYYRWTTIDADFDAQASEVVRETKTWWNELKQSGYRIQSFDQNGLAGVRIERPTQPARH